MGKGGRSRGRGARSQRYGGDGDNVVWNSTDATVWGAGGDWGTDQWNVGGSAAGWDPSGAWGSTANTLGLTEDGSGTVRRGASLAAQWRFHQRVIQRLAPEQPIEDPRRELRLGDHVVLRYAWDCSDFHGIVSSIGNEVNVVHLSSGRLCQSSLSQLAKGAKLARMLYPMWACQLQVPSSTTVVPSIEAETWLEPLEGGYIAQQALHVYRSGTFRPTWSQSTDIDFCLRMKTGRTLEFEIHGQKSVSSSALSSIGCLLRGDEQPPWKLIWGGLSTIGAIRMHGGASSSIRSALGLASCGSGAHAQVQAEGTKAAGTPAPVPISLYPSMVASSNKIGGTSKKLSPSAKVFVPATGYTENPAPSLESFWQ